MSEGQTLAELSAIVKEIVRQRVNEKAYATDTLELHWRAGELDFTRIVREHTTKHGKKSIDTGAG